MTLTIPHLEGNQENYRDILNAIIGDKRDSMIDLACCTAPHTPTFGFKERKYVDMIHRDLDHAGEQEYFVISDILDSRIYSTKIWSHGGQLDNPSKIIYNRYDVSFALDAIEHLYLEDGFKLLKLMEEISDKQILFTPLDNLFGMAKKQNKDPEAHRSLWKPHMVEGYAKIVLPEYHKIWNGGAWFFWKCDNLKEDFIRVYNELKTKQWWYE